MEYDLAIRGGRVIDGTGNKWFRADIGVREGLITRVGRVAATDATRSIEVDGMTVAPGFIDMHSHSDLQILTNPTHEPKVRQGVTTDVLGQDGLSYAPVTDQSLAHVREQIKGWNGDPADFDWSWRSVGGYLDRLDQGIAINAAYLIPHSTLRLTVMGPEDRAPTADEMDRMKQLIGDGMKEGAVGLSTGLTYAPGMYATDDELVELCSAMRGTSGYYCPHHRNYGMHAIQAYTDSVEIARRAGVPLHLAHSHLGFQVNRDKEPLFRALLDQASNDGVDVTLDAYPYLAGSSYLHAYLPSWVHAGTQQDMRARLTDPSLRERIRAEMEDVGSDMFFDVPMGWEMLVVGSCTKPENARWQGKTVAEAAAETRKRPVDFYCELVVAEDFAASMIARIGNENNVQAIMQYPEHTVGSDGILTGALPHPRGWGTFPRFLEHYVRELGVVRLERAVRKMTSLPAQRLGLPDRGLLRAGMAADIVCFDFEDVHDVATFEDPRQSPTGVEYVIVNGVPVIDAGNHTGSLPGRSLRPGA